MGNNNTGRHSTNESLMISWKWSQLSLSAEIRVLDPNPAPDQRDDAELCVYLPLFLCLFSLFWSLICVRPASLQPLLFGLGIFGIAAVLLILPPTRCIWRSSRTPPQLCQTAQAYTLEKRVYNLTNTYNKNTSSEQAVMLGTRTTSVFVLG